MDTRSRRILHCAALVCVVFVAYAYFVPPPAQEYFGTNVSVRFYLTKSLVLDKSFAIEKYYGGGIDAAYFQGHYYSGKAPATSFLAVPVCWCAGHTIGRLYALPDWVYLYLVQVFVIALPSVLMVLLMHAFLCRFVPSEWYADLIVIGYSLGTMAFPYSTQFVGHQLAAVFLFCCFLTLLRWRRSLDCNMSPCLRFTGSPSLLFYAGLFGGLAVAADYQVLLILGLLFLFTVFSIRRPLDVLIFTIGCVPGVFFVLLYNYACFGDILSFPYAHEAMPIARQVQSQGLFGIQVPQLVPFLMLLVSPFRGLFFVSPFLLLAIPGLYSLAEKDFESDGLETSIGVSSKRLFWLCLSMVLVYMLLISSYRAWAGGAGYGPRFLIPVIPFFIPPIASLMTRERKGYGIVLGILVVYSVLLHFVATAAGASAHEHLWNPVREFLLPSFLRGNVRPNWLTLMGCPRGVSLVALAVFMGAGITLLLVTREKIVTMVERSSSTLTDFIFLWVCILIACAMFFLFRTYRTEESAYRYAVIGHSYDTVDDESMAVSYFERSLRMDPLQPYVLHDLAGIYVRQGACRKALEINIRALAARRNDGELQGRCSAFMELCDISDRIKESHGGPELYLKRADILERMGYHDIAEQDREWTSSRIAGNRGDQPD